MSLNNKAIKGCMVDIIRATDAIKSIIELETDSISTNNKVLLGYALDRIVAHADSIIKRTVDDE